MTQKNSVVLPLMTGWKFHLGEIRRWTRVDHDICYMTTKAGYETGDIKVLLNENDWQDVTLPHDWSTGERSAPENYPDNGFKPRGVAWYMTEFTLPPCGEDACFRLEFDGVMGESVVYVNGVLAARSETGYVPFSVDISDYVLFDAPNRVFVSVDTSRWEGWWYEGAGIYRDVRLSILPRVHLPERSAFVKPVRKDGFWAVEWSCAAENTGSAEEAWRASFRLIAPDGSEAARSETGGSVAPFSCAETCGSVRLDDPLLWSPDSPVLYHAEFTLHTADSDDTACVPVGFRTVRWTDHGLFINDKKTPVNGICCHQDHAGVGIALPDTLVDYRVRQLKAMGCNAYRCAHNAPSEALLNACDRLGMLIMAENRHFRSSAEALEQLDTMVKMARNHPCVFLYSLFNEEPWQNEPRGRKIASRMLRRVRALDDSRAVTAAMNGGTLTKENASDVLDVAGMNYSIEDYAAYAVRRPGHPVVATENGPLYATRGIYKDDKERQVYNSYGLTTSFFGQTLQETLAKIRENPHVAGLFVWGGFDYRGEPQPFEWPSVFSHWGLTDNCAIEKDTFYMLKSYYGNEPMLHLLPHWNHAEGETVRVCAMTNLKRVSLTLNGKSLGEKDAIDNRAEWEVPFEAGTITAVATGNAVTLSDSRTTAGPIAAILAENAGCGPDCTVCNIALRDANGIPVVHDGCDIELHFDVRRGTLIGCGNGDPNGIQPDVTDTLSTFCGRCQAIIRPDADGVAEVSVTAKGLPETVFTSVCR